MRKLFILIFCFIFILSGCVSESINKAEVNEAEPSLAPTLPQSETMEAPIAQAEQTQLGDEYKNDGVLTGRVIVVDAGHGINSYNKQEPIAPNTSETKIAFASGTHGINQTEEELNLSVAIRLQEELKKRGASVYMTRTEHESDMTNIDRAEFANELNADLSIKIHADGIDNSSVHGVSVLVPGSQYISNQNLLNESRKAGDCVLEEFVKSTGASNRGIFVRNDLTGFNWTKVPIILVEMGFMTNIEEDRLMETEDYQNKMVDGITNGIVNYFIN